MIVILDLSKRDTQVLVGLYLAKFDREGLERLGFDGFVEAFNAFGYALNARPASLKNYRDELDPFFPNARQGWHKRALRPYSKTILDRFGHLPLAEFSSLVAAALARTADMTNGETLIDDAENDENASFANRLGTRRPRGGTLFPSRFPNNGSLWSIPTDRYNACGMWVRFQTRSKG